MKNTVFDDFKVKWRQELERNNAMRGTGGNKLRTYSYLYSVMEKNSIFLVYGLSCNTVHMQHLDAVWQLAALLHRT